MLGGIHYRTRAIVGQELNITRKLHCIRSNRMQFDELHRYSKITELSMQRIRRQRQNTVKNVVKRLDSPQEMKKNVQNLHQIRKIKS